MKKSSPSFNSILFKSAIGLAIQLLTVASVRADAPNASDYIWVEGENFGAVEPAAFKPAVVNASPEILSDGKWLNFTIEAAQADTVIPDSGILISYPVTVKAAADYEIWARLGYEKIRATFDWRIDQGDWHNVPNDTLTTDLQEIGVWAPVAWMDLGKQNLTAGNHTLQFRIDKDKGKDGKTTSAVFGLDALCFAAKPFHPDGNIKPGDTSWMTDADKAAATQTFDIPAPTSEAQNPISLAGDWQYAGDDEMLVDDRLGPVKALPSADSLTWHAMKVPGDRNQEMANDTYVHRYYLRTHVKVAPELAGHSFVLHIPYEDMIATVFVNGQQVGWTKNNLADWTLDVTSAIKPGQVNEICVAIKDTFYGLNNFDATKHPAYVPYSFWHFNLTRSLDMPAADRYITGLLFDAPSLVVGGQAYTADVFAKPSVSGKSLGLDVTVHNPTAASIDAQLTNEIQPLAGGAAEKTFAAKPVTIPAGQDLVVQLSEPWDNAKLWWPDDPQQYNVVTRLSVGGKVVDERKTKFGFREWTWNGADFKLNGIPWHMEADINTTDIAKLKEHGQGMVRVWASDEKTNPYLDECDAKGMPVRRTGIFDGEGAEYNLRDNPTLWANYGAQLLAWMKGQRNHPSIFIWSIENEITFINGHVVGLDRLTTDEIKKVADQIPSVDPTRSFMTDGGNANLDESLPIYGGHYMEPPFNTFPEGCYDKAGFAHRQVWPVTQDKPILLGEADYATGTPLAEHATIGGETTFLGKADAAPGIARELRMLSEGYRWNGVNFHFWVTNPLPTIYKAWQPIAVLSRQWNWTFGSGEKVLRTFGIFNDTRSTEPITFNWTLTLNGQKAGEGTSSHTVAPGMNDKFDVTIPMPAVTARQEGVLTLTLKQKDKTVFEDTKELSVLPPPALAAAGMPAKGQMAVFDPNKSVTDFLTSMKVPFTPITDLTQIPATAKMLLIGKDAIDPTTSTSSQLAAWAADGHVLIVLEQTNQLKYQAIPGEMDPATNHGCLAFVEDTNNPLVKGLQTSDFQTWGPDGYLYTNAYVKPTSGGKSIIQCDNKLGCSALVQLQPGTGLMLLSQLLVGEKIKTSPVAQQLLLNLVGYGAGFKLHYVDTSVVADDNPPLLKALDGMGLKYSKAADPLAAIAKPGTIAIINASPANLKTLAANLPKVKEFTSGGGWIVLNNLTPDGIADYDTLVGVNHVIRKFGREKVSWPASRNSLTAGISSNAVVLGTGKQIAPYQAGEWPDENAYSFIVDYDDAAPFSTSTYGSWGNAIGGFTMADGEWRLIQNLALKDAVVPIKLARPEKILQLVFTSDLNYAVARTIQLTVNGKDYTFTMEPNGDPQTFDIPDQPTASDVTFKIVDCVPNPDKPNLSTTTVGIDNIRLKVERPADFKDKVKPMLNIGGMVEYPNGKGGIILCNIKYQDSETNPANVGKKQAVLSGVLHNLDAAFSAGKTIIAGGNLEFTPIDISKQANQFRGDQGWFGDKQHTFAALPDGDQKMAGVKYNIYHFTTSVVPEAIMLGAGGIPGNLPDNVKGIPVNLKTDALFFLQAAKINQPRNKQELEKDVKYEMADYIVHYADGKEEKVPIYSEISVDNYKQDAPTPIPGAQIAWSAPYSEPNSVAVAYSMQWTNPHPDVQISSIDLVYGPARRGIPAVLAISAATAK